MQSFRTHGKTIIFVTAVIFIVGMATMGVRDIFYPKPYVGKIAGKKITFDQYNDYLRRNLANYEQENPDKEVTAEVMKQLGEQTWNQLIQQILLDKEIKRLGIKVKDKEVEDKILNNPPDFVLQAPTLQTNGAFDKEKYIELLSTNEEIATYIESYVRGNLPYEKLFDKIKSEVDVTEEEVLEDYKVKNDKADAKIIYFDPNKIDNVEVTEDEIKKYYDENKEEFKKEPSCKLKYVNMRLEASIADEAVAKDSIFKIYELVKAGNDFAELAMQYSQDNSASNGGDLGYVKKGRMVPEFENAVFSLKVGEISEPVKSKFGYHIIKVEDIRKDDKGETEVSTKHILVKNTPSEKTKSDWRLKGDELLKLAKDKGLDAAAEQLSLKANETAEFFADSKYISGLGQDEAIVKFSFESKVGTLTEIKEKSETEIYVAEVSQKLGVHYDEFETVKNKIQQTVKKNKQTAEVVKLADVFAAKYNKDNYLQNATKEGWEIVEAKAIMKDRYITKVGKIEELAVAVLALENDQCTGLVKSDKGAYIAYVENRIHPDMAKYEEEKEILIEKARTTKQNQHYNDWFNALKEKTKIIDKRSLYNI